MCLKAQEAASKKLPFELPNSFWNRDGQSDAEYKKKSKALTIAFEKDHNFMKKPSVPKGLPPPAKRIRDNNTYYTVAAIKFDLEEDHEAVLEDGCWLELGAWAELREQYLKAQEAAHRTESARMHIVSWKTANKDEDGKKVTSSLIKSFFSLKGGNAETAAVRSKQGTGWGHIWVCKLGGEVTIWGAKEKAKPSTSTGRFKNGSLRIKKMHMPSLRTTFRSDPSRATETTKARCIPSTRPGRATWNL